MYLCMQIDNILSELHSGCVEDLLVSKLILVNDIVSMGFFLVKRTGIEPPIL